MSYYLMMEDDPVAMIGLGILIVFALIATSRIFARHAKLIRNAKIREEDGTIRPPTKKEQFLIAQYLAHDKGKHFWHLIVAGIIVIAVVILVMKFVLIPRLGL